MDFSLSPEEQQLQKDVRALIEREITPEVVEESRHLKPSYGPHTRELLKKLGERGWLTPTWPKKYGGLDGTNMQRLIVYTELELHGVWANLVGCSMAGPTIMLFGTEEMKDEYLPRISRGEIEFALGYTEPQAGSDMAALDIRAVDKGDHFIVNGQKMFSTQSHCAEYHWLGARTSTEGTKYKGITLLIVDLSSPGITIRPLWVMDGERTNEVFYDDVRVPKKNMVGQMNRGFYHILTAVDFERLFPVGDLTRKFDKLLNFVKTTERNGQPLEEAPIIRHKLAKLATEVEIVKLLSYRAAWMLDSHIVPTMEASMLKLFMFETMRRIGITSVEILGLYGQLAEDSTLCEYGGDASDLYMYGIRRNISGGTAEIQRNVIATRGLGLPR